MFFNKKLQCVRCGKRHSDADLFIIDGVHVCKNCMSVTEKIAVLEKHYEIARGIVVSLVGNGVYLSDYNPAANSVMVLEGIDKLFKAFGNDIYQKAKLHGCKSLKFNDCMFLQVCKEGKL